MAFNLSFHFLLSTCIWKRENLSIVHIPHIIAIFFAALLCMEERASWPHCVQPCSCCLPPQDDITFFLSTYLCFSHEDVLKSLRPYYQHNYLILIISSIHRYALCIHSFWQRTQYDLRARSELSRSCWCVMSSLTLNDGKVVKFYRMNPNMTVSLSDVQLNAGQPTASGTT